MNQVPPNLRDPGQDEQHPLLHHLVELRRRLLHCIYIIGSVFLVLFYFSQPLYEALALPLLHHLPINSELIATQIASPFITPIKWAFTLACFISLPFILFQLWSFVAPGLYQKEQRAIWPLSLASVCLFYAGMAFAYFVVFPLIFKFFVAITPANVTFMPDIGAYLSFTLKLFWAFGLAFQVPIAVLLLIWSGVTEVKTLQQKRPYIIVGAFVLGMLLTPPDVISQTLLAIPLWSLFEIGLVLAKFYPGKRADQSGEYHV